jgi:hypothetical protein
MLPAPGIRADLRTQIVHQDDVATASARPVINAALVGDAIDFLSSVVVSIGALVDAVRAT